MVANAPVSTLGFCPRHQSTNPSWNLHLWTRQAHGSIERESAVYMLHWDSNFDIISISIVHFAVWNKLWFLGSESSVNRRSCCNLFCIFRPGPLPGWPSLTQRDPCFVWSFGRWCNLVRCDPRRRGGSCCGSFLPRTQPLTLTLLRPHPDFGELHPLRQPDRQVCKIASMQVYSCTKFRYERKYLNLQSHNCSDLWCMEECMTECFLVNPFTQICPGFPQPQPGSGGEW